MIKTILLLIFLLLATPVVAFHYDGLLSPEQKSMLTDMFLLMSGVAFICFLVSEPACNYSQTD